MWSFFRRFCAPAVVWMAVCGAPSGQAADHALDAARFRRLQQASDDGTVRPDGLANALQQRQRMIRARPKVGGIASATWTALGPGNIGGRIRSILTHPTDPNWLLVGSVSGGLWNSTDGGASWHAVDDLMPNVAIESLARDPNNPSRLYAGTGEGITQVTPGLGIFFSDDGGATWRQMPGTNPTDAGKDDFTYVERVAVDPLDSNIVVASSSAHQDTGGVWRTMNALSATPTWQKIFDRRAGSLAFDPHTPHRLLIGELSGSGGEVGIIADVTAAGANPSYTYTVQRLSADGQSERVEIAFARATPGLVLASLDRNNGEVYVSTDSGASWAFNSRPQQLNVQGWYANAIWVDPTDSTRAIAAGFGVERLAGPANWWTTNTPLTSTEIIGQGPGTAHLDQHVVVEASGYDGVTNRAIYLGNDGGIYRRDDETSPQNTAPAWHSLNNGLEITQFYHGAGRLYPSGATRITGGTQDNGALVAPPSGTSWTQNLVGDGGDAAVDPADPSVFYNETQFAAVARTTPAGTFFICAGPNPIRESACVGGSATNFITPFVLDPNNAQTMLVGASSLWRSTNVKTGSPPDWFTILPAGSFISAIAVASGNSDVIWVGRNSGELFCTTNGTAASPTWTRITLSQFRMVTSILIDPSDVNHLFVTFGGFNGSNVWEIRDPSQACQPSPTATNRHGNLPQAPVFSIARHALNGNLLYAGTEIGVFASVDGGSSWSPTNDAASTVSTQELFWLDPTTLVAATHGRGMFMTVVAPGTLQFTQSTASVAETAGSVSLTVARSGGTAGAVGVAFATADGTAHAGVDYTATQGMLSWNDGDISPRTITVPVLDDGMAAGDKTFSVMLSSATGGATLGNAAATVTVVDTAATKAAAGVTLGSSPNPSTAGETVTLTAAVSGSAGAATGSVTFLDGASAICDSIPLSSGSAACSTHSLSTGSHAIRAQYSGDATYNAATSSTVTQVVNAGASAFTLSVSVSGSGSVTSSPAGIDCGATCSASFADGTSVTLSAAAASGFTFAGWSGGGCFGTAGCTVTMNAAASVSASFSATSNPTRLGNISTRGDVLTGDNVMIGGFIIGGSANKTVAIVATGPSLAAFGITNPLMNPTIQLVRQSDHAVLAVNDDWQSDPNAAQLQASGFAPTDPRESGLYVNLPPGAYTVIVSGVGGTSGVALIGVFEVDHPEAPLINISTRGFVQTGNNVMIGGFIINGTTPQTVAITAAGPSLNAFGIKDPLANPQLTIVRQSDHAVVASNDDWQTDPNAAQLQAKGFAPTDPREAGLLLTLAPGGYTAIVSGAGNTTGVALVGVFNAQ